MADKLVIIGAGQAGFALAAKLRSLGDGRPVIMLGSEPVAPYQRPPLSKKYLLGEMAFDRLLFRPEEWYAENNVELRLSTPVEQIHREARAVRLFDGTTIEYGHLVFATGATPRRLPSAIGGDLKSVYTVRDKADADALAAEMKAGRRLLIVGGGYIGLEAAAVARRLGLDVVLIEMADRILARVAAKETADIIRAIHQAEGVDIREKTGLVRLIGNDGRVVAAELSDASTVDADMVIVGIGVQSNDMLAAEAGLETMNGIVVDDFARTSDPLIFAAGDCAVQTWNGERVRLESVQNAVDQAEAIAAQLVGGSEPYRPKPWFWSDQYDVKLQIAGFNLGYDETIVRAGSRPGSSSVWYFRGGIFVAVDAINDAKAYVTGKKLLETGGAMNRAVLADPTVDPKQLLA